MPELAEIEKDLWDAANKQLQTGKTLSKRNAKVEYLLSRMFHCQCGLSMGGHTMVNGRKNKRYPDRDYRYYRCNTRIHDHLPNCGTKNVRVNLADKVAWLWISRLLLDPVKMREALQDMAEQKESAMLPKQERLKEIEKRLENATRQMRGIMADLRALQGSTGPARELLQNDLKKVDQMIVALTHDRDRLVGEIEEGHLSEDEIATIERMAESIRLRLGNDPTFEQKRNLLRLLEFEAQYREEEDESRWMDMRCGLDTTGGAAKINDICVTSLDIEVLDHVVIGTGKWVSLKERGLGF